MAIAFVAQRLSEHHASSSSWTTSSFTAGTTGNLLVAVIALNAAGASSVSSITDNGTGSAWQLDVNTAAVSGVNDGLCVASTTIGSGAPTTLTINLTVAVASAYKIAEFSGVATAAWLDVAGTSKAQAANTTATTNTLTPAVAGELIIGGFAVSAAQSGFTAGANYSTFGTPTNTANPDVCAEYNLNGTTSETNGGTYAANASTAGRGVLVAYKAAATGPPFGYDALEMHYRPAVMASVR